MILENPRRTSRCATGKGALIILQGYKAAAAAVLEDVVQKAWRKVLRTMKDDCKVCTYVNLFKSSISGEEPGMRSGRAWMYYTNREVFVS